LRKLQAASQSWLDTCCQNEGTSRGIYMVSVVQQNQKLAIKVLDVDLELVMTYLVLTCYRCATNLEENYICVICMLKRARVRL
jgi:hypothetical protein